VSGGVVVVVVVLVVVVVVVVVVVGGGGGGGGRSRSHVQLSSSSFPPLLSFNYVHTPLTTTLDAEGAGEQFLVTTLVPEGKVSSSNSSSSGGGGGGGGGDGSGSGGRRQGENITK